MLEDKSSLDIEPGSRVTHRMNLREQLRHILPEILPADPADPIKGTELIRLVRLRLGDEYSDATLRYHFSILSYDPSSPIAKVDQGQGYYQRLKRANGSAITGDRLFEISSPEADAARLRHQRAAAIFERLCLLRSLFPFQLNGRKGCEHKLDTDWEVPHFVTADWDMDASSEESARFDEPMIALRRHLGGPEACLAGVLLKLSASLDTLSADFFQAVSSTRWAVQSELVVAEPVTDEALVDAMRRLGHQFGVGITSLGIDLTRLDDLPPPEDLRNMSAAAFESVHSLLHIQKVTIAASRPSIDWTALSSLRKKHESVSDLVRWLSESLDKRRPADS